MVLIKEPITAFIPACYRLCIFASGSLITDMFSCLILTKFSCLHLGQNNGKFSNIVSLRILIRVLLLQVGHKIHSVSAPYLIPLLRLLLYPVVFSNQLNQVFIGISCNSKKYFQDYFDKIPLQFLPYHRLLDFFQAHSLSNILCI